MKASVRTLGKYVPIALAVAIGTVAVSIIYSKSPFQLIPSLVTSGYYALGSVHYLRELGKGGKADPSNPPLKTSWLRFRPSYWPGVVGVLLTTAVLAGGGPHASEASVVPGGSSNPRAGQPSLTEETSHTLSAGAPRQTESRGEKASSQVAEAPKDHGWRIDQKGSANTSIIGNNVQATVRSEVKQ
jgi:hypothetical protein